MSTPRPKATLCTVLTPAHVELGALNLALTGQLNPATPYAWSIAFNPGVHTPPGAAADPPSGTGAASGDVEAFRQRFPEAAVRMGPSLERVSKAVMEDPAHRNVAKPERRRLLAKYLGSYHHAAGLAVALAGVKTRYAVVIDPDFYVVRPGWIAEITGHMQGQDLAVFGAPWSPRWRQKYRGFPSTHLMAIDLEKIPAPAELLKPDLLAGGRRVASPLWSRFAEAGGPGRLQAALAILRRPARAIAEDLAQRREIGGARDTGYGLMQDVRARPELKTDLVQAVFRREDGFLPGAVTPLQSHPLMEALLPEHLRYLPRRHVAARGFAAFGYPDFRGRGWEEFLWRGEPFAVHVRGELQRRPGRGVDFEGLRGDLSAILARLGHAALRP